jgi:hypothetical protein
MVPRQQNILVEPNERPKVGVIRLFGRPTPESWNNLEALEDYKAYLIQSITACARSYHIILKSPGFMASFEVTVLLD